ncbi:DUF4326 domain-containing protein [Stakelama tenebrarum]|uniref:DUF4326 domain-containing protein n=1 Tax=Stakelama tenebrarum TaxID=2711215 RepID=A0A6G6Y4W3_9SPHN|nr:DUF4326 domain-containing protein [Sphingosinithalassobacter tenebrarum]QIG79955.1 DUF4326 domain-containing protein [Sphingosinithalassobacter tenebrarum]
MNASPPIFVGRSSLWNNPFEGRPKIGAERARILYGYWLPGTLHPYVLRCAGFGHDEIDGLERMRKRVVASFDQLRDQRLICRCGNPRTCHRPILARASEAAQ